MEGLLLIIKHRLHFLWRLIDWVNSLLFLLLYRKRMNRASGQMIDQITDKRFLYRKLTYSDINSLHEFLTSQTLSDLLYFRPHGFDIPSLHRQLKNHSFLMMGVFDSDRLTGYFFLRFFVNRKCFVGRLIDKPYRGKGIGINMNRIMYEIAWEMGFRCFSTISLHNNAVLKAHANNPSISVIKKLPNDYLLVEFLKDVNRK